MKDFTTDITSALVAKKDLKEVFREHLEKAMNDLLQTELSSFLDYEKYERVGWNTGNSRNGSYSRKFETEYGELNLIIPRDRNGKFQNQTVAPYERRQDSLETTIIHLFKKGVTVREISDLVSKMYGHHYSPTTISNLTKVVDEQVQAFNNRRLDSKYICIFLDATVLPIRRVTVEKEAIHSAVGIRADGTKEIIAYTVAPNESASVWEDLLYDIKRRGVEEVLVFVTDGLTGLKERIMNIYPASRYQTCLVHISRNLMYKVRTSDKSEIAADFRKVHTQEDKQSAEQAIQDFINKWSEKYPKLTSQIAENNYLLTFYDFPEAVRKTLYSTNLIESMHKHIKRYAMRKEQFPNEESLERFIVSYFNDYNQINLIRCHGGWSPSLNQIGNMFNS